jgi:hypothetical protein
MTTLCTKDLHTHTWRLPERTMLSTIDHAGFYSVFLIWECTRCARRVWADGVLHQTTRPLSPVEWETLTEDTTNPWQQQVERTRRAETQREALQARIWRATAAPRRRSA